MNDALVAQGEDYTIGIVYALPLLASDGTEIAQSILMREQEGGPIFWAAVKKWLAEKTVKTVGNMLCDAFLYWVKEHPRLTIDFVEIRASYLNEEIVGGRPPAPLFRCHQDSLQLRGSLVLRQYRKHIGRLLDSGGGACE